MPLRRRASGNDGAYRVLEKLAHRRSVNLGDPSTLGMGGGGQMLAQPPLMVHRTGSAPPAPGLPLQQVGSATRECLLPFGSSTPLSVHKPQRVGV